jgi:hypothetical protein
MPLSDHFEYVAPRTPTFEFLVFLTPYIFFIVAHEENLLKQDQMPVVMLKRMSVVRLKRMPGVRFRLKRILQSLSLIH